MQIYTKIQLHKQVLKCLNFVIMKLSLQTKRVSFVKMLGDGAMAE